MMYTSIDQTWVFEGLEDKEWILYTDGGSKADLGGYGVHGYMHESTPPVKKIPKNPTNQGYDKPNAKPVQPIHFVKLSAGVQGATNNQMEMIAIYAALKIAHENKAKSIILLTDSDYCKNGLTKWYATWQENQFKRPDGTFIKNKDLWIQLKGLYDQVKQTTKVKLVKVKGHDGEYGNEKADSLATEGRLSHDGKADHLSLSLEEKAEEPIPAQVKDAKNDMHPIFSKTYLYINTNIQPKDRLSNDGRHVYYMGRHTGKKVNDAPDPDVFLGKPSSEHSYAIVFSKEPDPVIEHLAQRIGDERRRKGFRGNELCVGELTKIKRSPMYRRHFSSQGLLMELTDERRLTTHDGIELMRVVKPVMIAYATTDYFNALEWLLTARLENRPNIKVIDITDDLYDTSTSAKGKVTYKVMDEMKPGWKGKSYTTTYPYKGKEAKVKIKILADMDLPDRNALAKLAGPDTKVELILYPESAEAIRYACLVRTPEIDAIFSSVHSNRVLLRG